jgi:hypothetical protein
LASIEHLKVGVIKILNCFNKGILLAIDFLLHIKTNNFHHGERKKERKKQWQ